MKWISVKDKMPSDCRGKEVGCSYEAVLIYVASSSANGGRPLVGIGIWGDGLQWEIAGNVGSHSDCGFWELDPSEITHWAPINLP